MIVLPTRIFLVVGFSFHRSKCIMPFPSHLQSFSWKIIWTSCFPFAAFKILSLSVKFLPFSFNVLWLWTSLRLSCLWLYFLNVHVFFCFFFPRLDKCSAIIPSNKLSSPFSVSSLSGPSVMLMLHDWCSSNLLNYLHFFEFFFIFFCSAWVICTTLSYSVLISSSVSSDFFLYAF